jgi:uncharacterized protein YlaI
MIQSEKPMELNIQICDAFDCYDEATEIIEVKSGDNQKIKLYVCQKCVAKFE